MLRGLKPRARAPTPNQDTPNQQKTQERDDQAIPVAIHHKIKYKGTGRHPEGETPEDQEGRTPRVREPPQRPPYSGKVKQSQPHAGQKVEKEGYLVHAPTFLKAHGPRKSCGWAGLDSLIPTLPLHPVPGVETTEHDPDEEKHQGPGIGARPALIDPNTEGDAA